LPIVGAVPDQSFYHQAYAALRHGANHKRWPEAQYIPDLYTLTGMGSRGLVLASLCADLLCQIITPNVQDEGQYNLHAYLPLLHPARFLIRNLKRSHGN